MKFLQNVYVLFVNILILIFYTIGLFLQAKDTEVDLMLKPRLELTENLSCGVYFVNFSIFSIFYLLFYVNCILPRCTLKVYDIEEAMKLKEEEVKRYEAFLALKAAKDVSNLSVFIFFTNSIAVVRVYLKADQ